MLNLSDDLQKLIAYHRALQNNVAIPIHTVELKYILRGINGEVSMVITAVLPLQALSLMPGGRAVHSISWRREYGGLKFDKPSASRTSNVRTSV